MGSGSAAPPRGWGPPASVSRGAQALAQPSCARPGLSPRFSSGDVRNPAVPGPTVHSAEIENPRFGNVLGLDLREGMAAHTENTG